MQNRPFEAGARGVDGVAIIDMAGEINRNAEPVLNAAYSTANGLGATKIVLNFSAVDYINSTGIAVIVGILAKARRDQRDLGVYGLSDHYRTIFEITRLLDFMTVFPDESSALGNE